MEIKYGTGAGIKNELDRAEETYAGVRGVP
jgi:hypothetical protein